MSRSIHGSFEQNNGAGPLVLRRRLELVRESGEKIFIADFQGPVGESAGRKVYRVSSLCGRELLLARTKNDKGMSQFEVLIGSG